MDKGLLQLLDVIANNPHDPVLARRFIALVSELDQNTKEEAMLRLADIQIDANTIESLRLAKLVYNENPRNVNALEVVQKCMRSLGKFAKAEIIGIEIEKIKSGKGPTTLEARREQVAMIEKLTSTNLNPKQAIDESEVETEVVAPPPPPPSKRAAPAARPARPQQVAQAPEPPMAEEVDEGFQKDANSGDDIFAGGQDETEFMGNVDMEVSQISTPNEMTFQPPSDDENEYDLSFDEIPISAGRREPLINTNSPQQQEDTSYLTDETEVMPPVAEPPRRAAPQQVAPPQPPPAPAPQAPEPAMAIPLEPDFTSHQPEPLKQEPARQAPPPPQQQWQQPRSQSSEQSKSWLNVLSKIRSRKPIEVEAQKKAQAPKSIPVAAKPEVASVPNSGPPSPATSAAIQSASNPNLNAAPKKMPPASRPLFSGEFLYEIFQLNRHIDIAALRAKTQQEKPRQAPTFEADVLKVIMAKVETMSDDHMRWEILSGLWGGQANADTLAVIKKYKLSHQSCGMWGLYLDSLMATSDARKALYEIYRTLKEQNNLAWAQVAWARLPAIWDRLKVWGHTWQAEEGVPKLIELVERRRPPKFSAFAAQDYLASATPLAKSA